MHSMRRLDVGCFMGGGTIRPASMPHDHKTVKAHSRCNGHLVVGGRQEGWEPTALTGVCQKEHNIMVSHKGVQGFCCLCRQQDECGQTTYLAALGALRRSGNKGKTTH